MTICDAKQTNTIFIISMKNKIKHLRVRLSAKEFDKLTEVLVIKETTKSSLVREALNTYLEGTYSKVQKPNKE
jgi:hypothetical protein